MIKQENCKVIKHRQLTKSIYELTLSGEIVKEMIEPGQFVHLKVSNSYEPLLRRPISICSIEPEKNEFTIIYRAEGRGTTILSEQKLNSEIDCLGPLGRGFPINEAAEGDTVLLVGGGVGTPPLYELSKQLTKKGVRVVHIFGFESKDAIFYEDEFRQLGQAYYATVDGSYGERGFVTDVLPKIDESFSAVYACGPSPMLKALQERFANEKLFISLEERMGCGIGACFACVCKTPDNADVPYKKICTDGPVFNAKEVII